MKGALDVHRTLLGLDVPHEIVRLRKPVLQAEDLPEALGVDDAAVLAVRVYVTGSSMVAVALPVGRTAQVETLLLATGARTLRAATVQEINAATEFAARLVPPLLLPADMPLFVDAGAGRHPLVHTATGDTGTALKIRTADLLVCARARVADLTTPSLADVVVDIEV